MVGKIFLYIGPMFSGKTTELIKQYRTHKIANASSNGKEKSMLFIKNARDDRYSISTIRTHDGDELYESEDIMSVIDLQDVDERAKESSLIFIDEGQFFKNLSTFCLEWIKSGALIYIAALDAYANHPNHDPWPEIINIIPFSFMIKKLIAICHKCGKDAPLTMKLSSSKIPEEEIGHSDKYYASCIPCAYGY